VERPRKVLPLPAKDSSLGIAIPTQEKKAFKRKQG